MSHIIPALTGILESLNGSWAICHFEDSLYEDCRVFVSEAFLSSISNAPKGATISLVQVEWDSSKREMQPQIIVLYPDYLLDVSAVSECMRDYGSHPYYYFINRLEPKKNTAPLLLGNAANYFLDIFLHAKNIDEVQLNEALVIFFQMYAIELADCGDLKKRETEREFFDKIKIHFEHLKFIVKDLFPQKNIRRENVVVEPSFISPTLGLQGRLDLFEKGVHTHSKVIELKSGKTPFADNSKTAIGLNHQTQASLYQIIVQQVLDIAYTQLDTYICYSKCAEAENPLRLARPSMQLIAKVIEIRNQIVLLEHNIVNRKISVAHFFEQIFPEKMIQTEAFSSKLVNQFVAPQIQQFANTVKNASDVEKAYFFEFYRFLAEEQYLSKCGMGKNLDRSMSALWRVHSEDKIQNGTTIVGLSVTNMRVEGENTFVSLQHSIITTTPADFREGDSIVLYPKNTEMDTVANHQIFKGSIIAIKENEICLRLRNRQHESTLPTTDLYAMEHDVLDNNFTAQFRGLFQLLNGPQHRKDILLKEKLPTYTARNVEISGQYLPEIQQLIQRIENVEELFLLVGPPGTGKTSIALKSFVDHFYQKDQTILLMAYTNRAVDEICLALESLSDVLDYVRLGSHVNCPHRFQPKLLVTQGKYFKNRRDVDSFMQKHRVFVGTVAAVMARSELLHQKHFDLAIVDEASQILEPQLLATWSAIDAEGKPAIDKFVLIGDMKQLPAVVCQENGSFQDSLLIEKGIVSGKMSFFERMYRAYKADSNIVGFLTRQGRMHPKIADFSNKFFYENLLTAIPLQHQLAIFNRNISIENKWNTLVSQRLGYVPISSESPLLEAETVAEIASAIWFSYEANGLNFEEKTLGIIAPFRSHIARIRKALDKTQISAFRNVIVDTVERFQGSQRDVIIFSFAVYDEKQLRQLTETLTQMDGVTIDRKMNVALTRAREQFFFVGNDYWVEKNNLYKQLKYWLMEE